MYYETTHAEQRALISYEIAEAERHGDLMEIAKGLDRLDRIPAAPQEDSSSAGAGESLPVCDVRWALELAAEGGYGITYSDHAVQDQMRKAYVLVTELIDADQDYNRARSDLRQAEAELGPGAHKTLGPDHPDVVRFLAASDRRADVLTRALGKQP